MLTCTLRDRLAWGKATRTPPRGQDVARAQYSHIRVRVETLARLRAECIKLAEALEAQQTERAELVAERINPKTLAVTMDQLLNYLLDEPARKRRAARESRERKRQQRKGE